MIENYYVRATKINARIADIVVDGAHIEMDGYRFEKKAFLRLIYFELKFTLEDFYFAFLVRCHKS